MSNIEPEKLDHVDEWYNFCSHLYKIKMCIRDRFSQVEDEQQAKDEDILEISKRLISKNKQAYEGLAK